MRTKTLEILNKVRNKEISPVKANTELWDLFSVSNNEERVPFCDKHKEEMTYDTNVNEHFCWTCEHGQQNDC
jgi:hypothetical protein